jgi:hypothetical protein
VNDAPLSDGTDPGNPRHEELLKTDNRAVASLYGFRCERPSPTKTNRKKVEINKPKKPKDGDRPPPKKSASGISGSGAFDKGERVFIQQRLRPEVSVDNRPAEPASLSLGIAPREERDAAFDQDVSNLLDAENVAGSAMKAPRSAEGPGLEL